MPLIPAWLAGPRARAPAPASPLAEEKSSPTRRLIALTGAGQPRWTPRDYAALAKEGYAQNPVAHRCVRLIAEACASLPLVAHTADGARGGADHPLQRLLDHPNPEEGGPDLLERFFGALQCSGNGYLEAAGEPDAPPSELYALRPDRVRVVPGADGWPAGWIYTVDGREALLARAADGAAPVLHLKLYNPLDDVYGLSPLEAAARAVDVHNASSAWNKALLDNSARPSGALVYGSGSGERLTEEQFGRLKAELADQHSGALAAGRPLLLEGGLDWKPMALTPAELDFAEADSYQAASVVRRAERPGGAGPDGLDLPVVMDADEVAAVVDRRLARALTGRDVLTVAVAPAAAARVEPGDRLAVDGVDGAWRVLRVDWDETPRLQLTRADEAPIVAGGGSAGDPRPDPVAPVCGPPALAILDLPPLPGAEDDTRPLAAVAASPWRAYDVFGGADASTLALRGRADEPALMRLTGSALPPGPLHRFDRGARLLVRPAAGGLLTSRTRAEVLGGAGALAVADGAGGWEVLQYTDAQPTGDGGFLLSGLLRGQLGTEDAMVGAPAGARWVALGPELARLGASTGERGLPLLWRAALAGGPAGGTASSEATQAWRARAWRPFSPAHLRAVRTPAGLRLTWVRRARVGGDSWTGEVPLEEPVERYRVVVETGAAAGAVETSAPSLDLSPADLAGAPYALTVFVAQWGGLWGDWGAATRRTLLL